MARKKVQVHKHYEQVEVAGKVKQKCLFCHGIASNTTERMRNHLKKCQLFLQKYDQLHLVEAAIGIPNSSHKASKGKPSDQEGLITKHPKQTIRKDEKITLLLSKALLLNRLPVSLVQQTEWQHFFKALNPSFSTLDLSIQQQHDILSLFENTQQSIVQQMLKCTSFGVIVTNNSNWKNCYQFLCSPIPLLFGTYCPQEAKERDKVDIEAFFQLVGAVNTVFDGLGIHPPRLYGFCTSNDKTREGLKQVLLERKSTAVNKCIVYGCLCTALKKFVSEVLESKVLNSIFTDAFTALKHFYSCNLVDSPEKFTKRKGNSLDVFFSRTGVGIQQYLIVLCARKAMDDIKQCALSEGLPLPSKIKLLITSSTFWNSLNELCAFLKPVHDLIEIFNKEISPLSSIIVAVIYLKKYIEKTRSLKTLHFALYENDIERGQFFSSLTNCVDRIFSMISHPVLFLAFVLDPAFETWRRHELTDIIFANSNIMDEAKNGLHELCESGEYNTALCFQEFGVYLQRPLQKVDMSTYLVHPKLFWAMNTDFPNLAKVAYDIFHFPTSSTNSEGILTTDFNNVTGNEITEEEFFKNASIYYNHKQLRKLEDVVTSRSISFIEKLTKIHVYLPSDVELIIQSLQSEIEIAEELMFIEARIHRLIPVIM